MPVSKKDRELIDAGYEACSRMVALARELGGQTKLQPKRLEEIISVVDSAEKWMNEASKRPNLSESFAPMREVIDQMKEALKPLLPTTTN